MENIFIYFCLFFQIQLTLKEEECETTWTLRCEKRDVHLASLFLNEAENFQASSVKQPW